MGIIAMCYGDGKNPKTLRGFSLKVCKYLWDENHEDSSKTKQQWDDNIENYNYEFRIRYTLNNI